MSSSPAIRDSVFISYSHKDKRWLEKVQTHLKPFARNKSINFWDDTKLRPGSKWKTEIQAELSAAKVAVLLVTADFLDSNFINDLTVG
jgi:hypothetical protein